MYGYGGGFATDTGFVSGATVGNVITGGAAATAGLQAGDIITSLNGKSVTSATDVSNALTGTNPGDRVTIGWTDQAGGTHTATVTLGASPVA
jgi:S1-C subfamily serine protease